MDAFKAAGMEESKILEWSNAIDLIDDFIASKARGFIKVRSVHFPDSIAI